VIDGGSTDGTVDILRNYENEYDLHWISEPDKGQSHALNKGFRQASGEIIGWLNSDDTYMSKAILTAAKYLVDHPDIGWVYGDGYLTDEHGSVLWKLESQPFDFKKLVCDNQYIIQPTVFFRREVLNEIGLLDTSLHMTLDYDLFIRAGRCFAAGYIPRILATRRLHLAAKSIDRTVEFGADAIATLDKLFSDDEQSKDIVHLKNLAYSNRYFRWAVLCFREGHYKESRRHMAQALRLDPRLFTRKTFAGLALFFQGLVGVQWYRPGDRGRRRARDSFSSAYGQVSVGWRQ
jgi:glycosyltransferase involved in cell wall biosynthesis